MKLVTVDEMRALERYAEVNGVPTTTLMQTAGRQVALAIRARLDGVAGRRIVVLVGPGNNGGDALVTARHLHDWGAFVRLFLLAPRSTDDPNYGAMFERGIPTASADDPASLKRELARADVVLDGVLGIGRSRPLEGSFKAVLDAANEARVRRTNLLAAALDVPSGLDADTAALDPSAFLADLTLTLGTPKRGLYASPGAEAAGEVQTLDIGIPPGGDDVFPVELMTPESIRPLLPQRPQDSNKGTYGRVLVIAGSANYIGAAGLACRGALRVGSGIVTLASTSGVIRNVAASLAEATYLPLGNRAHITAGMAPSLKEVADRYSALVIGCGLGLSPHTHQLVYELLTSGDPLHSPVIDADALNAIAGIPDWWADLKITPILTPHPGEMARLLGCAVPEVQADRIRTATDAAARFRSVVALKGAYTVVAAPDGRVRVSPFAVPALATPGTGDVLAGATAGLLAQGLSPFDAATARH